MMNVHWEPTTVTPTRHAEILMAVLHALVILDSQEMGQHAQVSFFHNFCPYLDPNFKI